MARHKYRKTNNSNRQNNKSEEYVTYNEGHDHNNNNNAVHISNISNNNNTANVHSTTTAAAQIANNVNTKSTSANESEHHNTERNEESNTLQEKEESSPLIESNGHIVSQNNLQSEHNNKSSTYVNSNGNNDIINHVNQNNGISLCKTTMQTALTKYETNTNTVLSTNTTNDTTEAMQSDVKNNLLQTPFQVECTLQAQKEEVCVNSSQKEFMAISSDSNVILKSEIDDSNSDKKLKHTHASEVNESGHETKSISESPSIATTSSEVNKVEMMIKNEGESTLEFTTKENSVEELKKISTSTSSLSPQPDPSCLTNAMMSTNTLADVTNTTNTENIQLESSLSGIKQSPELYCEYSSAEENKNESSTQREDAVDANNDVEDNKNNTTQNDFARKDVSKNENDSDHAESTRYTLMDVRAAMTMKPRKSALRVNSPSFSQNCVINNNNSKNSDNSNINNSCCNASRSNSENSNNSNPFTFSSSQVQSNGVDNNISSISNDNSINAGNSKDDSTRSRRRIRFCEPVVTFQDDGQYSHYYSSYSNVKHRPCPSEESQEHQSNAKTEEKNGNSTNDELSIGGYGEKKDSNSSCDASTNHEEEVKMGNVIAKTCPTDNKQKEIQEYDEQIHNSHELERERKVNDNNYVNGSFTSNNEKDTKRIGKSHTNKSKESKIENGEVNNNKTFNLNSTTDVGICNGNSSSPNKSKYFVTLPQNRLNADTFEMLRRRTIDHVQKMRGQLRLRVIVCVLCIAAVVMRPVLRRWLNVIVKRIVNIIQHKSLRIS